MKSPGGAPGLGIVTSTNNNVEVLEHSSLDQRLDSSKLSSDGQEFLAHILESYEILAKKHDEDHAFFYNEMQKIEQSKDQKAAEIMDVLNQIDQTMEKRDQLRAHLFSQMRLTGDYMIDDGLRNSANELIGDLIEETNIMEARQYVTNMSQKLSLEGELSAFREQRSQSQSTIKSEPAKKNPFLQDERQFVQENNNFNASKATGDEFDNELSSMFGFE